MIHAFPQNELFLTNPVWKTSATNEYMPATVCSTKETAERALANYRAMDVYRKEGWRFTLRTRDIRANGAVFQVFVVVGRRKVAP
jgi:hypothetical protein